MGSVNSSLDLDKKEPAVNGIDKDSEPIRNRIAPKKVNPHRSGKEFGLPCSSFDFVEFESSIVVETCLWQEYCEFDGRIEYYSVQSGDGCHAAVCMRRADGVQTDNAALVELLIRMANGINKKWIIQVSCHKWDPKGDRAISTVSEYNWNTVSYAVGHHCQVCQRLWYVQPDSEKLQTIC